MEKAYLMNDEMTKNTADDSLFCMNNRQAAKDSHTSGSPPAEAMYRKKTNKNGLNCAQGHPGTSSYA